MKFLGALLGVALAAGTPTQAVADPVLTPEAFYNSFNMRTVRSMMGPSIGPFCESYPKDFFIIREQTPYWLLLDFLTVKSWEVTFYLAGSNTVYISEIIPGAMTGHGMEVQLEFDPVQQEWVGAEYFPPPDDCTPFSTRHREPVLLDDDYQPIE